MNKLVLEEMPQPNAALDAEISAAIQTSQMMDSNAAETLAAKRLGLIERIPKFICWRLIDSLEIFDHATLVWKKYSSYGSSEAKTAADGIC